MPIQPTYPGVYIQEIPSGTHTIAGVATSITAFVGYLRRGPPNVAVQCLNYGDFQRVFGGLDDQSETSFQVSQFFLNGGSEAWVSRLYASASPPVQPGASLTGGAFPKGGSTVAAPSGSTLLGITAQNPGTWGENVLLSVDYMSSGAWTFDLTATLYNWTSSGAAVAQVQSLQGVTLDARQPNYVVAALDAADPTAGLIGISDPNWPLGPGPNPPIPVPGANYAPPTALPFATGTILTFAAPAQTATNITLTVTLQAPAPPGGKAPAAITYAVANLSVTTLSDIVGAIQGALAVAGAQNQLPTLGSAVVRTCTSPFPLTVPGPVPTLIQVMAPDPNLAGYMIGIAAPNSGLGQISTNVQAIPLSVPPPAKTASTAPPTPPDGALPSGFDIAGNAVSRVGIYALDAMGLVNIVCVPDMRLMADGDYLTSAVAAVNYALKRRAFAVLDIPSAVTTPALALAWVTSKPGNFGPGNISAASYFPQPLVPSPFSSQPRLIGACGTMAGLYAATDVARGVWKAPAGITAALAGVQQLQYAMTDQENGLLNPYGMNALRTFPIYDNIAWGARTLAAGNVADDDWKYVSVRRLTLYIEQSLFQGLQWAVFEPNDETLWAQIRLAVTGFMQPLFQQGAFVGQSPDQGYQVICDASTTTAQDMDNGVVNLKVLFAPVKPAEFVVISIQQMAGQSSG